MFVRNFLSDIGATVVRSSVVRTANLTRAKVVPNKILSCL